MIHSVKLFETSKTSHRDDVSIPVGFMPFRFDTVKDRVNLWVLLFKARQADRPVPKVAGMLLTYASDVQLWTYVQEIDDETKPGGALGDKTGLVNSLLALDMLAYFHGQTCTGDPETCLNPKIQLVMDSVYDRLEAVLDKDVSTPA